LDNPTHALAGLMLSRAGLNRLTPGANLLLILAANAPDVDAISWLGGSTGHLHYHRWYTHSWLMLPLIALLPVLITRVFVKERFNWGKAYLASMIGVASHILLDMTNSYGVRSLAPLRTDWLAMIGPFLSSLVSGEIGGKKSSGQGWAIFALLFICLYDAGRFVAHDRAMAILNTRIYNGETPRRVGAFPQFANPLRWNAVVELNGSYWTSPMSIAEDFDPTDGRTFFKSAMTPEVEAARATEPFRVFADFNQWQLWRSTAMPEGVKVELFDLRFGNPIEPGFKAEATVLPGGRVADAEFQFGQFRLSPKGP
jgi:inner membrane protein